MADAGPDAITRRLLRECGIAPGMRVLELGCGRGDVSLLLAAIVGSPGEVVGIDRDEAALDSARGRIDGASTVRFVHGDVHEPPPGLGTFDAIVGRRVLMYLSDPAAVIARCAALLRPGGVVAFQEHDATMTSTGRGEWPLHDRVTGWIRAMVEREGGDPRVGSALPHILSRAGLEVQAVRAEGIVEGQDAGQPLHAIARAVQSRIVGAGIATDAEIGIDDLEARLAAERESNASIFLAGMAFCAWARRRCA